MSAFASFKNRLPRLNNAYLKLVQRFTRFYLGIVTLFAFMGYAYVLLFPLLVLVSLYNIHQSVVAGETLDWHTALTWTSILILAGIVCYRAARLKIVPPTGLTLSKDKAPVLFRQVNALHARYKRPEMRRIIITGKYEVDIIKTPRWVLPIWSSNTIVIGLPVLQSLSPEQFDCMLARRIGQFSKRDNLLTNWLYQVRQAWQQIQLASANDKATGIEPLKWFFALYTPFYSGISAYAACLDELHADSSAMQLYNDEVVRNMITVDALSRWYIEKRYWPAVYKITTLESNSAPSPHSRMAAAIRANLKGEKLPSLMAEMLQAERRWKDPIPSLRNRINNIGHNKPFVKEFTGVNAGVHYLGSSMDGATAVIDKLWKARFIDQRKRQRQKKKYKPATRQASNA